MQEYRSKLGWLKYSPLLLLPLLPLNGDTKAQPFYSGAYFANDSTETMNYSKPNLSLWDTINKKYPTSRADTLPSGLIIRSELDVKIPPVRLKNLAKPHYPIEALEDSVEADVDVAVIVDKNGRLLEPWVVGVKLLNYKGSEKRGTYEKAFSDAALAAFSDSSSIAFPTEDLTYCVVPVKFTPKK